MTNKTTNSTHKDRDDHPAPKDGHDPLNAHEFNDFARSAFEKSAEELKNAEIGKTTKFMGFEVDAGLAGYLATLYNMGSHYVTNYIAPKSYEYSTKLATKAGFKTPEASRIAAVTTFGVNTAIKSAYYITPMIDLISDRKKEVTDLVHQIAPVLDDLKGNHSVQSFYDVKAEDNEVIYAHRKRLGKMLEGKRLSNGMDWAINVAPNVLLDVKNFKGMWQGKDLHQLHKERAAQAVEEAKKAENVELGSFGEIKQLGNMVVQTTTGQVSDRIKKTSEAKLRQTLAPYSALEMIHELELQVSSNPEARSFEMPRSFQNPSARRESYGLEEYLMRICIAHQKEMSDISPNHTEIREALREDLAAAVKPVAKAIRKGDISALSLIHFVGEGKIIRNHGRAIAAPADIQRLIEHESPKQTSYIHIDPAEYYKDAAFTREDLKTALATLQGNERQHLMMIVPDAVLEEAGIKPDDIKTLRTTTAPQYERILMDTITGLSAKPDKELKTQGLSNTEIKQLRKAYAQVEERGLEAIHDFKASPTNPHGIEQLLSNWAVEAVKLAPAPEIKVAGDKAHHGTVLGQVVAKGHAASETLLEDAAARAADDTDEVEPSFADRELKREPHEGQRARE